MQKRRRRTLSSSTVPSHQSVHSVSGARWGARDDLGWVLKWVEDNLGMRSATAVAKMVEKGSHHGSRGAMQMVWSDLGVVARTLGREGTKNLGLYLIVNQSCTTLGHQLENISPTGVLSRPSLGPISRPHPLWRPRMPRGCLGRPRTGSGVGGITIWDARGAGGGKMGRKGSCRGT